MSEEPVPTISRAGNAISYHHLRSRDVMKRGKRTRGVLYRDQHADVIPGQSVRLHGVYGGVPYDKVFKRGDLCEYELNGVVHFARIVAIGERTVTVNDDDFDQIASLEFPEFSNRNRLFDEAVATRNRGSVRVNAK